MSKKLPKCAHNVTKLWALFGHIMAPFWTHAILWLRPKTIEKTSVRRAEGCIGGLGLLGGRPADFLEFAFADSDPAEVVSELNR